MSGRKQQKMLCFMIIQLSRFQNPGVPKTEVLEQPLVTITVSDDYRERYNEPKTHV
jgi:hypothetical protein